MATIRPAVVRRLHDAHHWQLCQGWNPYVSVLLWPCPGAFVPPGAYPGKSNWTNDGNLGFVAFDQYKRLLADAEGKVSGPRAALAGFAAGVTESLLAVTPTESIKTQLYVSVPRAPYTCFDSTTAKTTLLTTIVTGSMTASAPNPECAASSTPSP